MFFSFIVYLCAFETCLRFYSFIPSIFFRVYNSEFCALCFLWDFPVFRVYGFIYLGVFSRFFFSVLVFICVCLDISYPLTDDINVVTFYVLFVFLSCRHIFHSFFSRPFVVDSVCSYIFTFTCTIFFPSRVFVFSILITSCDSYVYFWINVFNLVCGFPFNFIKLLPQLLFSSKTFVWIQSMWKLISIICLQTFDHC